MAELKLGNGLEDGVNQGPLIEEKAVEKVEQHIADALAKGASCLTGGKRSALGGTFFEPTVLSGVTAQMAVAREETSGLCVQCSVLKPKPRSSRLRTIRNTVWQLTFIRLIPPASGASAKLGIRHGRHQYGLNQ